MWPSHLAVLSILCQTDPGRGHGPLFVTIKSTGCGFSYCNTGPDRHQRAGVGQPHFQDLGIDVGESLPMNCLYP